MALRFLFVIALVVVLIGSDIARATDDGDALPALVQLLAASDDPQFHLDILKGMSEALKGRQNVKMPAGWAEASAKLSTSSNPDVRALTASLSTFFGDVKSLDAARKTAADKSSPPAERTKALTSLLDAKVKDLAPLLQQLLGDPPVRAQALRGLAAYDDANTASAILSHFKDFTPPEELDALNTLASREAYALPLLKALNDKSIPRSDLTAATIRQLAELKNDQIDQWIKKNWGAVRTSPEDKIADMKRLKETILSAKPNEADRSRGRAVFAKTCAQCHTLFGEGGKVGPDLTGSGRADLDYIMTNVVDPSAVVGNDYLMWIIRLKDKRLINGIITREDDNAITVQSENEQMIIPRPQIERMKQSEISMMPEGLLQGLERKDLLDLVAYLRSADQVPLPK